MRSTATPRPRCSLSTDRTEREQHPHLPPILTPAPPASFALQVQPLFKIYVTLQNSKVEFKPSIPELTQTVNAVAKAAISTVGEMPRLSEALAEGDALALKEGRVAFKHTGAVPCVLHSNGHKGILHWLAPHVRTAAAWAVTPPRAKGAGGGGGRVGDEDSRERQTWLNGAWRKVQLKELRKF